LNQKRYYACGSEVWLSLVGLREAIRSTTLTKSCNEHVKRVYNQGGPGGSSGGICPQSTPKNSQNPLVERESRLKVNDELLKIIGLSSKDRLKAARLIVCQHEIINLFFSVPDHEKEELVRGIINDA
jgi:hypothetical protein